MNNPQTPPTEPAKPSAKGEGLDATISTKIDIPAAVIETKSPPTLNAKMERNREVILIHACVLPLLVVCSWFFTMLLYGFITNWGAAVSLGFLAFPDSVKLDQDYRQFVFHVEKSREQGSCTITVMNKDLSPVWDIVSRLDKSGVSATIIVNRDLVDDPESFDRNHFIPIVSIVRPEPGWFFRYNRDITFDRPIGPLRAELKAYAANLAGQKNSGLSAEDAKLVAVRSAEIIDECYGLSTWEKHFPLIRLISGPIQELILILCVFSILMAIFEGVLARYRRPTRGDSAIESAEVFVDLVPYVGFFGTIYGMANALWYLGGIDLSDPVEKATKIGPITGNISLAMEASQLGILFFLVASIILRIIRVSIRHPT